jgi:NAD(P)H-hydrate repair Nnr-like enzyme with NAD(P)H-hydrate dehydratase domain
VDPLDAAVAGVYLHGYVADYVVEEWGSVFGLQAGDLVDWLPIALGYLVNPPPPEDHRP